MGRLHPVARTRDAGEETHARGSGAFMRYPASNFRAKMLRNERDMIELVWGGAVGHRPTHISLRLTVLVLIFYSLNLIHMGAVCMPVRED